MDKKSKVLIWIFVVLTAISIGYTFYKTVILQDFQIIFTEEEPTNEEINGDPEIDLEVDTELNNLNTVDNSMPESVD